LLRKFNFGTVFLKKQFVVSTVYITGTAN